MYFQSLDWLFDVKYEFLYAFMRSEIPNASVFANQVWFKLWPFIGVVEVVLWIPTDFGSEMLAISINLSPRLNIETHAYLLAYYLSQSKSISERPCISVYPARIIAVNAPYNISVLLGSIFSLIRRCRCRFIFLFSLHILSSISLSNLQYLEW